MNCIFQIAMNYGSRDEITQRNAKDGTGCGGWKVISGGDHRGDDCELSGYCRSAGSGSSDPHQRRTADLSNFLMWQLAYTEFYFTDVAWPDFHKAELVQAIEKYNQRDRRYGGVKEEQDV